MKTLLTSRKFWMALIALTALTISAFLPGFELDQERAAGLAVIVVSYIIGVAVDPGPGGWRGVIQSRKFGAALVGLAEIAAREGDCLRAAGLLGLVCGHPLGNQEVVQTAGPALALLREKLDPQELEGALEQGRGLDLEAVVADLLGEEI